MTKSKRLTFHIGLLCLLTSCYSFDKEAAIKEFKVLKPDCEIIETRSYECDGTLGECWYVEFKYKQSNSETVYDTTFQYWKKDDNWTSQKVDLVSINQVTSNYDSLRYYVKVKGDTNAYDELFYGFIDANEIERTDSVIRYSNIMATNFGFEKAYWHYLSAICEKNQVKFDRLYNLDLTNVNGESKKEITTWLDRMLVEKLITEEEFNSVKK